MIVPKFSFNQVVFWLDLTTKKVHSFEVKGIKLLQNGFVYSGDDNDLVNDIVPENVLGIDRQTAINVSIKELISSIEDDAVKNLPTEEDTTFNKQGDGGC